MLKKGQCMETFWTDIVEVPNKMLYLRELYEVLGTL